MTSKNFLLTLNEKTLEFYQDIVEYVTNLNQFNYMLVCEHIGQENKHYHMYLQYKTSKRLSTAKLYGAHIEKWFGSAQRNIAYCKAEDAKHKSKNITAVLIDEIGEPRLKGGNWTIKSLRECNDDAEIPAHLYNIKRKLEHEFDGTYDIDLDDEDKEVEVFYIQGPSGIGKSKFKAKQILKQYRDIYGSKYDKVKFRNNFWLGVHDNVHMCLYDEFRDTQLETPEFIEFINYAKSQLNSKGGSVCNNYNIIIFTSVQRLSECYKGFIDRNGYESCKQWFRRINLIDCYPPVNECIGQFLDKGEYKSYTNCYNECIAWKASKGYY